MREFKIIQLDVSRLTRGEVIFAPSEYSISCHLIYDDDANSMSSLEEEISANFRIYDEKNILSMGVVTFEFDGQGRIIAVDSYTNAARWKLEELSKPPTVVGLLRVTSIPDTNNHYESGENPVVEIYDSAALELALKWQLPTRWVKLATCLTVGLNESAGNSFASQLAEIRFAGVAFPVNDGPSKPVN